MGFFDEGLGSLRQLVRAPVGLAQQWKTSRLPAEGTHELAVCAIFREEAPFLDEWVGFHVGVGVTQLYLYNNHSTDNYQEVLQPWIERGYVTLIDWPYWPAQREAYYDCVKRARNTCRWVAFIDLDEFLFSPQTDDIRPILRRYEDLPGVEVWHAFFGSGGHVKRPDLPVTEAYLKRAALRDQTTVKTIADPRMLYKIDYHQSKYWLGRGLDTSRQVVSKEREPVVDVLRINHYWSRSLEDLETKIARNDASIYTPRDRDYHINFEKALNAETDETIVPLARSIREKIKAGAFG